jgi:hypothetical protein
LEELGSSRLEARDDEQSLGSSAVDQLLGGEAPTARGGRRGDA